MIQLIGDTAIVTGGAQGIGLGCVEMLLAHGASVVVADYRYDVAIEACEMLNGKYDKKAIPVECDVTSATDVQRMVETTIAELGKVDILVNNAGGGGISLTWDIPEQDWDRVVNLCLKGTFLCTKEVINHMLATGNKGAIINMSSLNYIAATDGMASYCAAKAGVSQFTKVVAAEIGRHGIRVNAVAPGSTHSPTNDMAGVLEGLNGKEFLDRTPLGRIGEPEDIARVVVFLASDYARWVTGVTINVDGGQHIRGLHSYWDTMIRAAEEA